MLKKRILIISYSPLHKDPRILRQIEALRKEYVIETMGYTNPNIDNVKYYEIIRSDRATNRERIKFIFQILIRKYEKFLSYFLNLAFIENIEINEPNIIIANDWDGLYLASKLIEEREWNSTKTVFDAHEYAPAQFSYSIRWLLLYRQPIIFALQKSIYKADIITTVCEGIAAKYENVFKLPENSIKLVTNASSYNNKLKPIQTKYPIKIIHHGGAIRGRKIERTIDMMKYLPQDKYILDLMLVKNDPDYYNQLVKRASKYPNIHFIPPVGYHDIVKRTNQYDIGVFILKPTSFNAKYALPNKLFEYIQARLAIAIGPSIEMKKIVRQNNIGIIAKRFSAKSLAKEILSLSIDEIMLYKNNSHEKAYELSDNGNIKVIEEIITGLVNLL